MSNARKTKVTKASKRRRNLPIELPAKRTWSERVLVVTFNVTELSDGELSHLQGEIAAQSDRSEGHPSLPNPTMMLRTIRYEHDRTIDGSYPMATSVREKEL